MTLNKSPFVETCFTWIRKGTLAVCIAFSAAALGLGAGDHATYITFDVPGAGSGPEQGTFARSINPAGAVTGSFVDADNLLHGFVRFSDNSIGTFDAPGGGNEWGQGTLPFSINAAGVVTGAVTDINYLHHAFVRMPNGVISMFTPPGATDTVAYEVNSAGFITGVFLDAGNVDHGFVRATDGSITSFDCPGAGTGSDQGTEPDSLNSAGSITGDVLDANNVYHGFLRLPDGTCVTFDAPEAGAGEYEGTVPNSIDDAGAITGIFLDSHGAEYSFVRAPDGTFTTFGASAGSGIGLNAVSINSAGTITGIVYGNNNGEDLGFVRPAQGMLRSFNVPGAGQGGHGQGTFPAAMNVSGAITGDYVDSGFVEHAFIRTP